MRLRHVFPLLAASAAVAQNLGSGTQTITVSGSAITVGGTNAATITVGSNTFTVNAASSTSGDDASATADADDAVSTDDGTDDADDADDADDTADDGEDEDGDTTEGDDGATISGYTHTPTTLTYGSSKIVLGPSAGADAATSGISAGFSNSANFTGSVPITKGPGFGGNNPSASKPSGSISVSATATPQGPTTTVEAAPTDAPHSHSGAAVLKSAGSLMALVGAGLAYLL
ncbi:hypothetical protein GGR50DRAFT_3545 [Xylaria sp. CBS 124048]|nr:hypothetical protein GGR50DRAFT_3545 [Xylaria sp. CBS 124048]